MKTEKIPVNNRSKPGNQQNQDRNSAFLTVTVSVKLERSHLLRKTLRYFTKAELVE
ncbi:MAG: hypothetical protein PHV59_03740 [Victivallales bacterium]|nr:hypothetical protein [Victivallales bacterium]